jgi:hypothetical protein
MMLGGAVAARRRQTAAIVRVAAAELPANRVYQRSSGVSLVPLSGTYTGAASAVSARVIDAVTSVEAKTWTTVAAAPTGNTWSGTLSVPQGGWYRIQYRLAAETTAIYTAVNQFGVGDIWMFAGQSQQARMSTLSSFPPTPDTRTVYFISGTTWTVPGVTAGTNGNGAITFLNRMRATTTVPQACIQVSVEGTAISDWEVSDAAYTTAISRLTSVGEIAGVLWHQGTSDVGVTT